MEHAEIINALGGPPAVAIDCNVDRSKPYVWRTRGIPPAHWLRLVAVAKERGVPGVTIEALAAGASPRCRFRPASAARAALA